MNVDPALVLRALGASTPDLVYVLTRDGRYTFVNEPAARVLGLEPQEMIGRTWAELGLPLERESEFVLEREQVMDSGIPARREVAFPTPTGERSFEYVVSPIYDDSHTALGIVVISRDITDRVNAESALRMQLQVHQAIDRSLRPGLATLALDGRITWASASFIQMFGWSYDELLTFEPPYPFWPPEEIEHIVPEFQRVMSQAGAPPPLEFTFRRKNEERFPVEIQPSPLVDEEGELIGWLAIATDLTERAQAERRHRDLADAMPQIVWSARADGTTDYFNKRWYEFTGLEPGVGDESWLPILHPDDVERALATWYGAVARRDVYDIEYRFFDRAIGSYRWHLGRALPVLDAKGNIVRWYGTSTDIHEQKIAQAGLERQNFMLRTLLDVSEILSAERDLGKLLRSVADAAMMLAGAEFAELFLGEHSASFSGHRGETASLLEVPLSTRGRIVLGHSEPDKFGEEAERLVTGVAAQAVIAIDNATLLQRVRVEEERYRTLVTATSQVVWSTDADGTPRGTHGGMRELLGISLDESRAGVGLSRIHPADLQPFMTSWRASLANASQFEAELRIRMASGAYRWYSMRGVPVKSEEGTVREWIGTATDIDDRKRAAEAQSFLTDASALLTESLDPHTILSRLATLAVPRLSDWCAIDIAHENGTHERLIIAHPDREKAAMITEVDQRYRLPPEINPIVHVLTTGKPILLEHIDPAYLETLAVDERHAEIIRALAITSWVLVPIASGGRTYASLSLVHTEESGRRFSEADLTFAEDLAARVGVALHNAVLYGEAQAANRAKDEFLATLSHELRTPMTAILGWARMLELGDFDPALLRQGISAIASSAKAQSQLIDDLLDVSRIAAGKLHLELADVDVNAVVLSATDAVRATANVKSIVLETELDPTHPHVSADANRLQQVVWNLLNNAVKFTPSGGEVRVTVDSAGDDLRIRVSDNGEGFAPEFIPHMFDRFRQADSTTTRRFGGLGLGLAIVKQITAAHGGSVEATSPGPGRGATFTLRLPLTHNVPVIATKMAQAMPDLGGADILVVDDDPHARRYISAALERAGAAVRDASNAADALRAIRARIPAVLVSDIAMPARDGYALLEDVRTLLHIDEARLPAIAITAFGGTEDRVRILSAGFQRYILKPADPVELARIVADVLLRSG